MSLVAVMLAALLLAGLARHSMLMASRSIDVQTDLQRRWGAVSLRKALLQRAGAIAALRDQDPDDEPVESPVFPVSVEVPLGQITFHVVLADENAKINLNRLEAVGGKDLVGTVLVELLPTAHAIHLRPHSIEDRRGGRSAFDSWGQVFALGQLPRGTDAPSWVAENTRAVTCWGNGRVNAHRAEEDVLLAVCRRVIGPGKSRQLLEIRERHPDLDVNGWLDLLELKRPQRAKLRNWLTDKSSSYSLWLRAETEQRSWHELTVVESRSSGNSQSSHFTW